MKKTKKSTGRRVARSLVNFRRPVGTAETPRLRRRLVAERLETRTLLAADVSPFQNPFHPFDVNSDGMATAADAAIIVNALNNVGPHQLTATTSASGASAEGEIPQYVDVNGDGYLSALDAALMTKFLNGEGEGPNQIQFSFDTTDAAGTHIDSIAVGQDFKLKVYVQDVRDASTFFNETQTVSFTGTPTGGTFRLLYGAIPALQTAPIPFNATAAQVKTAVEAIWGANNTNVTGGAGGPWTIEFINTRANQNITNPTVDSASLVGATATVNAVNGFGSAEKGVYAAYLDVAFTNARVATKSKSPVDPPVGFDFQITFDPTYSNGLHGDVLMAGKINDVGGFQTSGTAVGPNKLLVFTVEMTATAAGPVTFTGSNANFSPDFDVVLLNPTVTSFGPSSMGVDYGMATLTVTGGSGLTLVDDAFMVNEDAPNANFNVLSNDSVTAPGVLNITGVTQGTQGGIVSIGTGNVVYRPAANFNGIETFTYTVNDGQGHISTATVTMTVKEANDAPTTLNDSKTTNEDVALVFNATDLTPNDSPGPANEITQTLTVISVGNAVGGTVSLVSGVITFTPTPEFNGAASFTYTVQDNGTTAGVNDFKTANGTVNVTVREVNDAPTATNDMITVIRNQALTFNASVLTQNDSKGPSNENGQTLTVISVQSPTPNGGTVVINGNGTITYTPAANFSGSDTFTYTVQDNGTTAGVNDFKTSMATVSVDVIIANAPPVPGNDMVTTAEDTALPIAAATLLSNDSPGPPDDAGQTLTITGVSSLSQMGGTVILSGTTITYTPPSNYNGPDSFTYTVTDNGTTGGNPDPKSAQGTVNVTVTEVNDAPTAVNDVVRVMEGVPTIIDLATQILNNDSKGPSNESGQTLTIIAFDATTTAGGTVVNNGNGTFTYAPPANFDGTDSFTYTIQDNGTTNGAPDFKSSTATVNISIAEVNSPPIAGDDTATTNEDTALTIPGATLLANDVPGPADENTQTLTIISVSSTSVQGGTVVLNGNGSVTYNPPSNYNGPDSFTYTIRDNGTTDGVPDPKTAIGTVNVTVREVNDAPIPVNDSRTTAEDTALVFNASTLTTNDAAGPANESGQTLTVISVGNAVNGTVSLTAGVITFTPSAEFNGAASFTYTVQDNGTTAGVNDFKTAVGTVNVTVTEVNDAPTAVNDTASVVKNTTLTLTNAQLTANDSRGPANEAAQTLTITAVSSTSANGGTVVLNGNGTVTYTPPSATFTGTDTFTYTITDNGTTNGVLDAKSSTATVTVTVLDFIPSNLRGFVYFDTNNNGIRDGFDTNGDSVPDKFEQGIGGVTVRLTGTDSFGAVVNVPVKTAADGSYSFVGLVPSSFGTVHNNYTISIDTPMFLVDGKDTAGDQGGTDDDILNQIKVQLEQDVNGQNNNFGEMGRMSQYLSIQDIRGSTPANHILVAVNRLTGQLWYSLAGAGWGSYTDANITVSSNLSSVHVSLYDASHAESANTLSAQNNAKVQWLGQIGDNYLIRLVGTAAELGIVPVAAGEGEGEGEAPALLFQTTAASTSAPTSLSISTDTSVTAPLSSSVDSSSALNTSIASTLSSSTSAPAPSATAASSSGSTGSAPSTFLLLASMHETTLAATSGLDASASGSTDTASSAGTSTSQDASAPIAAALEDFQTDDDADWVGASDADDYADAVDALLEEPSWLSA